MKELLTEIETKVLNDLDNKFLSMAELVIAQPEMAEMLDRDSANQGPKQAVVMYVLYVYTYAFHMRKRKMSNYNEMAW